MRNFPTAAMARLRDDAARVALIAAVTGSLLAPARAAEAQSAPNQNNSWELLFSSGALVPTGAQRLTLKDASLSTAQLSYVVRSRFAITGMAGWARSRDLASAEDPKLDVFSFDLGGEVRAPQWKSNETMTFTPFIGAGAGSRSYNHRGLDIDATHDLAGYGAVGGVLGIQRVQLRLEVRDYATRFKPLTGSGAPATRNDVVALLGLRLTKHR